MLSFYITLLLSDLPVLASRLRTGGVMSALALYLEFVWFVFTRKLLFRGKEHTFRLKFNECPFRLTLRYPSDLAPLVEIYVRKEYEHHTLENPKNILDLGANYGDSALYFHALYPTARIFAVEPAPVSFEALKKNVADVKEIVPLQAVVSDTTGTIDFYINETGALGNSLTQRGNATKVTIPSYTLPDLMKHLGIVHFDLIKFDVEGAESSIFKGGGLSRFSDCYMGEVHEDLMDMPKGNFLQLFEGFSLILKLLKNPKRSILIAEKCEV